MQDQGNIALAWPATEAEAAAHMAEWHGCGSGHQCEECETLSGHAADHEHDNPADVENGEGPWGGYREHQHEVTA